MVTLDILDEGMVFAGARGGDAQSATFPLACVAPGGRWLVTFRAAPRKGANAGQRVLLTSSDDQGRTWSEPLEPFPPVSVVGRPGRMRFGGMAALDEGRFLAAVNWVDDTEPDAPYFNEATEGLLDTRILLYRSDDAGQTWSGPELLDTAPFPAPTPLTGPPVLLPNGGVACPFELNKPYLDTAPWRHAAAVVPSSDEGRSWGRAAIVAQDPAHRIFYWDQRLSALPQERLLDVFWTFDRKASAYRNIHACESMDSGRTWSELWDTGVPGQPGPVFPLRDGALAMPYVDRTGPPAIHVAHSHDGGRNWQHGAPLVLYRTTTMQTAAKHTMQDAWREMTRFSAGLPHAAPLPGGGALIVYYAGAESDVTAIRWAVVA